MRLYPIPVTFTAATTSAPLTGLIRGAILALEVPADLDASTSYLGFQWRRTDADAWLDVRDATGTYITISSDETLQGMYDLTSVAPLGVTKLVSNEGGQIRMTSQGAITAALTLYVGEYDQ